jgi:hypothetical protein
MTRTEGLQHFKVLLRQQCDRVSLVWANVDVRRFQIRPFPAYQVHVPKVNLGGPIS